MALTFPTIVYKVSMLEKIVDCGLIKSKNRQSNGCRKDPGVKNYSRENMRHKWRNTSI